MLGRYLSPASDAPFEVEVGSSDVLDEVLAQAAASQSDRGIPAVELISGDGSTFVVGQTQPGAVLIFTDSLGDTFHSVGSGIAGLTVVFDYFGSYTEVPAEYVVPLGLGRAAALAFVNGDHPSKPGLTMEPD